MGKFEDLEKIQHLKDQGILNQEQFELEKYKILNEKNSAEKEESIYIISLVLGIFAILLCAIPAIGIIVSVVGLIVSKKGNKKLKKLNKKNGKVTGGIVLSILGLIVSLIITILPLGVLIYSENTQNTTEASEKIILENKNYTSFNITIEDFKEKYDEYLVSLDELYPFPYTISSWYETKLAEGVNAQIKEFYKNTYNTKQMVAFATIYYNTNNEIMGVQVIILEDFEKITKAEQDDLLNLIFSMPRTVSTILGDDEIYNVFGDAMLANNGAIYVDEEYRGVRMQCGYMNPEGVMLELEMVLDTFVDAEGNIKR